MARFTGRTSSHPSVIISKRTGGIWMSCKYSTPHLARSCKFLAREPILCSCSPTGHLVPMPSSPVSVGFFTGKLEKNFPRSAFLLYYKHHFGSVSVCLPVFWIVTSRDVTLQGPEKLVRCLSHSLLTPGKHINSFKPLGGKI